MGPPRRRRVGAMYSGRYFSRGLLVDLELGLLDQTWHRCGLGRGMRTTAETLPATLVALCSKFVLYEMPELVPLAETHLGGWFELHFCSCACIGLLRVGVADRPCGCVV